MIAQNGFTALAFGFRTTNMNFMIAKDCVYY